MEWTDTAIHITWHRKRSPNVSGRTSLWYQGPDRAWYGKSFFRRERCALCLFVLYSMIWLNVKLGGNEQLQIILSSCMGPDGKLDISTTIRALCVSPGNSMHSPDDGKTHGRARPADVRRKCVCVFVCALIWFYHTWDPVRFRFAYTRCTASLYLLYTRAVPYNRYPGSLYIFELAARPKQMKSKLWKLTTFVWCTFPGPLGFIIVSHLSGRHSGRIVCVYGLYVSRAIFTLRCV